MAWVTFGKMEINTSAVTDVTKGRYGMCIWSGTDVLVNLDKLNISREDAMKIIKDAEREERRQMFEENKDELLADLADIVMTRLNEVLGLDKSRVQPPVTLKPRDR